MKTEENKTEIGDAFTITKMVGRHTAKTQYRKLETNMYSQEMNYKPQP
jgi:hypothetical protein